MRALRPRLVAGWVGLVGSMVCVWILGDARGPKARPKADVRVFVASAMRWNAADVRCVVCLCAHGHAADRFQTPTSIFIRPIHRARTQQAGYSIRSAMDPPRPPHQPQPRQPHRRSSSSSSSTDAAPPHAATATTIDGPEGGGPLPAAAPSAAPSAAVFADALTEAARPCHLYYVYEDDVRV